MHRVYHRVDNIAGSVINIRATGIKYRELVHLQEGQKFVPERGFDVVVDDHLREVIGFTGKASNIIVFDHPWNQSLNVRGLFHRAYTWADVLALVETTKGQA